MSKNPIIISDAREKTFQGVWIPKEIYLDENLSFMEKRVLSEIYSLHDLGECYALNKHFANFCGVSTERITQVIRSLKEKGYIEAIYESQGNFVSGRIMRPLPRPSEQGDREVTNQKLDGTKNNFGRVPKNILESTKNNYEYKNTVKNTRKNTRKRAAKKPKNMEIPPPITELEEYIAEYAKSKGVVPGFTAERFFDYYAQQGWLLKSGKLMVDWKASVRTWFHRAKNNEKPGGEIYKKWEGR